MIIEFRVSLFGYDVGGHNNTFEIEIEDRELEGMNDLEKEVYIDRCINEYIQGSLEYGYEFEE